MIDGGGWGGPGIALSPPKEARSVVAVVEIRASHSFATQAVNVWHWRIPESNAVTEVNAAITALDAFYEAIKARIQAGTITVEGLARTVDQNPNEYIGGSGLTTTTTGATGGLLSASVVLSLKSNFVGGSRRGRKYLGPLYAAGIQADGRSVASSVATDVVNAATTLIGTTTSGIEFGVWSRQEEVFTPITTVAVNPIVGTQRRRLT
jgi:hypothetical protein